MSEDSNSKDTARGAPWAEEAADVVARFESDADDGLDENEASRRLQRYGENSIESAPPKSVWRIFIDQFTNFIVFILAAAGLIAFLFSKWLEGVSILIALFINAGIGFFTELKAVRSLEALARMTVTKTNVRRGGKTKKAASETLVPGDLVLLEGGDIVTADMRIVEASKLQVDESALTGESVAVNKTADRLEEDAPLAERKNMLYRGTSLTMGSAHAIVVATGMDTEIGRISGLAEEAESEESPLEKRLTRLGHSLIWIVIAISAVIFLTGYIAGREFLLIVETSIALAVAAIPEGLPIVATVALARGMRRMKRHNAVIKDLSSVETLGSTNTICTDKTGTLTQNLMRVSRVEYPGESASDTETAVPDNEDFAGAVAESAEADGALFLGIRAGVLCNNASLHGDAPADLEAAVGDPLEVALLDLGAKAGLRRDELLSSMPESREVAFDPALKMMATFHETQDGIHVAVKGAPEKLIEACETVMTKNGDTELDDETKKKWLERNEQMTADGLRVIATAVKSAGSTGDEPYSGLTFTGMAGMYDPPRSEVSDALDTCAHAGINVVMVTGDHPNTSKKVGVELNVADESEEPAKGSVLDDIDSLSGDERDEITAAKIFARVEPEQKLGLIQAHQDSGSVVAMTGDGVNDAPALKKADIGIAMGRRGTQVAREAADVVLEDDAFNTIVLAVDQGRAIFDNIRKFIVFLLSGNVGEIMIVAFSMLMGMPLPLLPLQILYLNLLGDVFPALALGVGEGSKSKMEQPPRGASEQIVTRAHWLLILAYGLLITAPVLTSVYISQNYLGYDKSLAVTISFLTLAFSRLWHVFNMRDRGSGFFVNEETRNPYVWGALVLCSLLLVAAVYTPGVSDALKLEPLTPPQWLYILGMSLIPWAVVQPIKSLSKPMRREKT